MKQRKEKSETKRSRGRFGNRAFGRTLLSAVSCTLLSIVVAGTICACLSAAYIERHPEIFKADLSLFVPHTGDTTTRLYYFPATESSSVRPDLKAAVELESESLSGSERAIYLPISEIPKTLQNAFVAIEDKRFYSHKGVDLRRTGAAIVNYVIRHDGSFGGSTITQQLIKNVTGENERTPTRKISEIFRALDLEKSLSKSEILEQYLNVIHLANGCTGVAAASELYFGKAPSDLTTAECASIAAITQNPTKYDPIRHPENNRTRRNNILREMLTQGYLSKEEYETAVSAEVITITHEEDLSETRAYHSYYTDLVVEDVVRDLCKKYGYTRAEASHLIYTGGLHIYTLVEPKLQAAVEAYYKNESNFPRLANGKAPQSAMIVLDPETGNILAVAGAIGEKTGDRVYSFATDAKRPPGSVIKPLSVYAPALEYGLANAATVYDDVPVEFKRLSSGRYSAWPKNASGVYRGLSTVDDALSRSLNTVSVRLLKEVGIERSFDFLKNGLGIDSLIESGVTDSGKQITDKGLAALALGQMNYGAPLREITAAYTAFSSDGIYHSPRSYAIVTDGNGQVLLDNEAVVRTVLSEETAESMTKMLENVTKSGTARSMKLKNIVSTAGKTGTTQYSFDRWFVGYTPYLLAGVWYGCETPETLESIKGNPALDIWDSVMTSLHKAALPKAELRSPKRFSYDHLTPVKVCADSGLLVSDACTLDPRGSRTVTVYLTESQIPKTFCTCHTPVTYSGTGKDPTDGVILSDRNTETRRTVGLLRIERSFPADVYVLDAEYTCLPKGVRQHAATDPRRSYYASSLPKGTYCGKSYASHPFNRPCTRTDTTQKKNTA